MMNPKQSSLLVISFTLFLLARTSICQLQSQQQQQPPAAITAEDGGNKQQNSSLPLNSTSTPNADTTSADPLVSAAATITESQQEFGSSTTEQPTTTAGSSEGNSSESRGFGPNLANFYYGDGSGDSGGSNAVRADRDENVDGSDLNFSLMNAPHERMQAVQNLINSQSQNKHQFKSNQQTHSAAMQCTHKGRQYAHGQTVPIEEQPCLNCTCRRAILQCYLRVCSPVISLESQRRMQQIVSLESGGVPQRCRTIKEPKQCCPSLRCEPEQAAANGSLVPTASTSGHSDANFVSLSHENSDVARVKTTKERELMTQQQTAQQQANNRSVNGNSELQQATTSMHSSGVKLPINSAQKDSILLITSNPSSSGRQPEHNSSQLAANALLFGTGNSGGRQDYAHALMEALLETVYSSAAQINGLSLQGSCMINGSLYVEGSAVIPEGNALCQYCYCIRQKVMCVRPKCHLIISGCTPKYSNEYACCPTSYSCASPEQQVTSASGSRSHQGPARLAIEGPAGGGPQSLSSKLWAAFESFKAAAQAADQQQQPSGSSGDHSKHQAEVLAGALMNSAGFSSAQESTGSSESPQDPTTTTANTVLPTTTTTATESNFKLFENITQEPEVSMRSGESLRNSEGYSLDNSTESNNDEGSGNEEDGAGQRVGNEKRQVTSAAATGSSVQDEDLALERALNVVRDTHLSERQATTDNRQRFNVATTEQPSSVSDFLEPMSKLGPLVASPSSCVENNRQYAIGEQIPTLESCKHCYCGLEGQKECKMIECSLKVAHNCRPITPEGHCCPIRYECPQDSLPTTTSGEASSRSPQPLHRYRSEDGAGDQFQRPRLPAAQSVAGYQVAPTFGDDVAQCKGDSGLGEDCAAGKQPASSESPVPTLDSTRQLLNEREIDHRLSSVATVQPEVAPPSSLPAFGLPDNGTPEFGFRSLGDSQASNMTADELNKFIMQINQNTTATTTSTMATTTRGYDTNQQPPAAVTQESNQQGGNSNETSQEMMINDQHSRMVDYHSVQLPPEAGSGGHQLPVGAVGIPHIQPAADERPGSPRSPTQYSLMDFSTLTPPSQQPTSGESSGSQRDSRSTNAHLFGHQPQETGSRSAEQSANDLNGAAPNQLFAELNQAQGPPNEARGGAEQQPPAAAVAAVSNDDYFTTGDSITSGDPETGSPKLEPADEHASRARLMREPAQNSVNGSAVVVVFDDELLHRDGGSGGDNRPSAQPEVPRESPASGGNDEPPVSVDPSTDAPPRPQAVAEELMVTRAPEAPQPTTGTPIGLEADRSPDSSGWLRSISGLVQSFGRRFSAVGSRQQTASGELQRAASGSGDAQLAEPTGRSRSQGSLLGQILSGFVGDDRGAQRQQQARALVLRPLADLQLAATDQQPAALPEAAASSLLASRGLEPEPEIVTAPVANEPEIFTQSGELPIEPVVPMISTSSDSNAFARRSDVSDELPNSSAPSSSRPAAQQQQPARVAKGCFDPLTNRTYQPYELIPKEDPCKSCSCFLGQELCQTLVCPEKPADDCREERRAGECCANYLCGHKIPSLELQQPASALASTQSFALPSTRFVGATGSVGSNGNRNGMATQRAMNVDSEQATGTLNSLDNGRRLVPQMMQFQGPSVGAPSNKFQQSAGAAQHHRGQPLNLISQQQTNPISGNNKPLEPRRGQPLPTHPIRTSDLANLLPPHLRFRPNSNIQAYGPNSVGAKILGLSSNNLNNPLVNLDRNKVLFAGPSMANGQRQLMMQSGNEPKQQQAPNWVGNLANGLQGQRVPVASGWGQFSSQRVAATQNQQPRVTPQSSPFNPMGNNQVQKQLPVDGDMNQRRRLPQNQVNNILPANVFMTRMSGQQLPSVASRDSNTDTNQLMPISSQTENNLTPWQPEVAQPQSQRPQLIFKHPVAVTEEPKAAPASQSPVVSVDEQQVTGKQVDKQRVSFGPPTQALEPTFANNLLAGDPQGFRPMNLPSATATANGGLRVLSNEPPEVVAITSPETATSGQREEEPVAATSSRPTSSSQNPRLEFTTSTEEPNSFVSNSSVSPVTGSRSVTGTEAHKSEIDRLQPVETEPTRQPILTPETTMSNQVAANENESSSTSSSQSTSTTTQTGSENQTAANNQSPPEADSDPLSMFRVSECNIYGRLYQVGQSIEELSDVCKRCTCTSMGVDCQKRC